MLSRNEIVDLYLIPNSDPIQKATRPLHDRFGIKYFTYHRIDTAGNYTVLLDRPDWAENYVSKKFYLSDPYLRHPSVYESGVAMFETFGSQEHINTMIHDAVTLFDIDLGVILIEKTKDAVEFFGFSGNSKKCGLHKLYLNHTHLLKAFAAHFKSELQPYMLKVQENPGYLPEIKGDDFFTPTPLIPQIDLDANLNFLKDLGMDEYYHEVTRLSSRELDLLRCLLQGHTAKDTAASLGLSPRTVESYFENIKNKLRLHSKHDLFKRAQLYKELNLL